MHARRDAEERQHQQELAAAMQQLQAAESVPSPEAGGTPPMSAAQRAAIYGESPNSPQQIRVIANIDTESSRSLINTRLAYVSISRASNDVRIYTNDAGTLGARPSTEVTKTAALDLRQVQRAAPTPQIPAHIAAPESVQHRRGISR
jgi:type IV secretion system protein VirB10